MLRKIVDGTHNQETVPSLKKPPFIIDRSISLVPINDLVYLKVPWKKYAIIGSGKTGLDAILHLLDLNVNPDRITWIVSNDCWYYNRDVYNMENLWDGMERQFLPILKAIDINDVYQKYEAEGIMLRVDKSIWPTKMRSGTITNEEVNLVRQIKNVIRKGRIKELNNGSILFENDVSYAMDTNDTLFVDCTSGSKKESNHEISGNPLPIFNGNMINLQLVLL